MNGDGNRSRVFSEQKGKSHQIGCPLIILCLSLSLARAHSSPNFIHALETKVPLKSNQGEQYEWQEKTAGNTIDLAMFIEHSNGNNDGIGQTREKEGKLDRQSNYSPTLDREIISSLSPVSIVHRHTQTHRDEQADQLRLLRDLSVLNLQPTAHVLRSTCTLSTLFETSHWTNEFR